MSDLEVPVAGKLDRRVVIALAAGGVAFVGYRYWAARQDAADPGEASDFEPGGLVPDVLGAVRPNGDYGQPLTPATDQPTTDAYGFTGTTNAQWTQYAATQLAQSDRWSWTDVVEALGNFLSGRPLTAQQQAIVQSAIALAGYAPVGTHPIVPGGNTAITVAPAGVRATASSTEVVLTFSPVAGAAAYRAYRGLGVNVGTAVGTTIRVAGLQPNTPYTFTVAAVTASGARGPLSAPVKTKTKNVSLAAPAKPRISRVTKTGAHASTGRVANATGYNWYVNGTPHGHSDSPAIDLHGLKAHTKYQVTVRADTATQAAGKSSAAATFTTKR